MCNVKKSDVDIIRLGFTSDLVLNELCEVEQVSLPIVALGS